MANYKTAMGKTVDMAALAAKNEKTRAVGNMKVNARGDTIDAQGRNDGSQQLRILREQYTKARMD